MSIAHSAEMLQKDLEIIIVDDDVISAKINYSKLNKHFSQKVLAFDKIGSALEHIRNHPNSNYLVLLEVWLSEGEGWAFLDSCEKEATNIQVIVLSYSILSADKTRATAYSSVLDYFEKPFLPRHLLKIPHYPKLAPYFSARSN